MTSPSRLAAALMVAATVASGVHLEAAAPAVQPALIYDGQAFADLAGGVRRGTTYLGTLRLQLTVDGRRAAGIRGMTLFVEGLSIHGGHPSAFAGDAQGVSSLEGPSRSMLYEAWIQQNVLDDRLSILVGRYDLNTEFYRLQSAGLFLNSSFGMGPEFSQSGRSGPSIFPDTSVGARIAWKPARGVVLRTAILDGVPVERPDGRKLFAPGDGLLLVAEGAYLFRPASKEPPRSPRFRLGRVAGLPPYTAKIALGTWHYTATYPDSIETAPDGRPVQHHGSGGGYAVADLTLFKDSRRPARRVNLFGELGVGDARLNHFASYAGTGIVISGLTRSRDNDELGVAIAVARNSGHFAARQHLPARAEAAIDCTYLAPLTSRLAIQPVMQYLVHPDSARDRKNAFVTSLRFEVSF